MLTTQVIAQAKKTVVKPITKTTPSITTIEATTKDGKKVLLKSDKTWDYIVEESKTDESKEILPIEKLEIPFTGDDVKEISAFYKEFRGKLAKNQYETEQEYKTRLQTIPFESSGIKKTANEIVFVIDGNHRYDAEKEIFLYSIKSYPSIAFSPLRFVKYFSQGGYMSNTPVFSFKMPLSQAKREGYFIKVAIFGYPVELDESNSSYPLLSFFIKRIVVFNTISGDIYYEQNL